MSNGTPVLSPAMQHVEALKTLSKKEDSLRQSFQSLEKHQDLEIHLPSELDTPQCSAMVRNLENALREGECDGSSRQGTSATACICSHNEVVEISSAIGKHVIISLFLYQYLHFQLLYIAHKKLICCK